MNQDTNGRTRDVNPQQKSALMLLFITFFIDILGFGLVLTLSPYYVQKFPTLFGIHVKPGLAVGALTAAYPILQLLFAPYWGRLSDRVGRRPIILLSLFGNAVAWLLFGLAQSLEVLFLARILAGIFSSASLPTVQAYIADSTPPEKRSVWIGIVVGMGFSFGFILGPPIGGYLGTINLSYPAFLAAAIAFCNFSVAFFKLPESLSPEMKDRAASHRPVAHIEQFIQTLSLPRLGSLLLVLGLSTFAMQNLEQNIILFGNKDVSTTSVRHSWSGVTPVYLARNAVYRIRYSPDTPPSASLDLQPAISQNDLGVGATVRPQLEVDPTLPSRTVRVDQHLVEWETGILLGIVAFIVGMIQGGGLRKMVPRFGETNLVLIGSAIAVIGFLLVPVAVWFLPLIGAASVVALGVSFISPCLRGLISQDSAAHTQGSVLGVSESVRGLAMASGPLLGGWLFDRGPSLPFILGAGCMLACVGLAFRLRGLPAPPASGPAPDGDGEAEALAMAAPR